VSISDTNAVITLTIPLLFPVPVQIQGFAADDVYDSDDVELATTIMGVDGILSGGFVNSLIAWNISLQADSPSQVMFEAWDGAQQALQDVLPAQANVTLTGLGRSYQMVTGFLVRGKRLPDAKKTLMPRKWRIDWQQVIPIPVGIAG
jgi:tail fiber protein gp32